MIHLLRQMLMIRHAEESLVDPIKDCGIRCPCHLCSGQEAVAVGVCSALEQKDYVFGNHRSHGHYLAKGGGLYEMFAEIYGAETGCAGGRGGSMHVIDPGGPLDLLAVWDPAGASPSEPARSPLRNTT